MTDDDLREIERRRKNAWFWGVFGVLVVVVVLALAANNIVIIPTLLALYFLPWVVAGYRGHRNAMAIGVLNILLGWTVLGWVAAMVWACTATGRR
jgi:hypothetical protein